MKGELELVPEQLIRCFIAVNLPDKIRVEIKSYLSELMRLTSAVKWVRVENIHLTLKFLGEIEADKVKLIEDKLADIGNVFSPFELSIAGSGCFPGRKNPRVFWLGLEQGIENPLFSLHQWIEKQLSPLGFAIEKRRFSPHLTLGRVKNQEDFSDLYTFLDQQPFKKTIFRADKLSFMQSVLKPTGAVYSVIHEYFFR